MERGGPAAAWMERAARARKAQTTIPGTSHVMYRGSCASLAGFDHFGSASSRVMTGSTSLFNSVSRGPRFGVLRSFVMSSVASSDLQPPQPVPNTR